MSDFLGAGPAKRKSRRDTVRPPAAPSPGIANRRALLSVPYEPPGPRLVRFFLADVQTGFGAFVSVYLTTEKWTQTDIGLVLTVGAFVGLVGQIPGGAIVDAARSERWVAAVAVAAVGISAFALAVWLDLCRRVRLSDFAGGRELRAGPCDRGDQPRPCWPQTDQRAPGPQRGFRFTSAQASPRRAWEPPHITFQTAPPSSWLRA